MRLQNQNTDHIGIQMADESGRKGLVDPPRATGHLGRELMIKLTWPSAKWLNGNVSNKEYR